MIDSNKSRPGKQLLKRRSFLNRLWCLLGGVALIEFIWVGFSFLRPRKSDTMKSDFEAVVDAGLVDDFEQRSVTAFPRSHFYLARLKDGGFLALSRRCTHLGCTVPWNDEKQVFLCPCHASTFDIRGEVISPPAPRAMAIYRVVIENNRVKVDTRDIIKRHEFEIGQVVYPSKI
jgi:cytochrome b6-f complex iron-sulfur subunit